jgi:hypothetical protein
VSVLSLVLAAWLPAQTPAGRTKVTIRGSGSDVTIEKTPSAPAEHHNAFSRSLFPQAAPSAAGSESVVGEVVRLKSAGADDSMALAYLRLHQSEVPSVITAEDVQTLRKAGVGKPFLLALTTLSAVDIGKTGEGQPVANEVYPPPSGEMAGYETQEAYGYGYGYPVAAGYGGYGGRNGMHHHFLPHLRPSPRPPISRPPFPHPAPLPAMNHGFGRREVGF